MDYSDVEEFKYIYLEDSFLLGMKEDSNCISFLVEAVLLKGHKLYHEPLKGEAHCYKKCEIKFQEIKSVNWVRKSFDPIQGCDEENDYGNIDNFTFSDSEYHVSGEWGDVFIKSDRPVLIWMEHHF
ncbi:hypothetical protein [Thalassospira sp.]|uniref:hypothetical protein n=1 Tax=Thalassospira sp. TaxID=1912094 RepID=UPI003AA860FB